MSFIVYLYFVAYIISCMFLEINEFELKNIKLLPKHSAYCILRDAILILLTRYKACTS